MRKLAPTSTTDAHEETYPGVRKMIIIHEFCKALLSNSTRITLSKVYGIAVGSSRHDFHNAENEVSGFHRPSSTTWRRLHFTRLRDSFLECTTNQDTPEFQSTIHQLSISWIMNFHWLPSHKQQTREFGWIQDSLNLLPSMFPFCHLIKYQLTLSSPVHITARPTDLRTIFTIGIFNHFFKASRMDELTNSRN